MLEKTVQDEIVVLRMAHGKVSALDVEFCEAITHQLDQLQADSCRGVILTGTGSIFSAGVDLVRLLDEPVDYLDRFLPALETVFEKLFFFPKPVVAAVNGHAVAGGCVLAAACDYRLMDEKSGRIGIPELRVGVPFPSAALEVMRFTVAPQSFPMLVTRGVTYRPDQAIQHGLVDETVEAAELMTRASEIAREFLSVPLSVFQLTKEQIRQPARRRMEQGRVEFDDTLQKMWRSEEIRRAVRQYVDRTLKRDK